MSELVPEKDNFQILCTNLMWCCNYNAWFHLLDFESTILHLQTHDVVSAPVWVGGPTWKWKPMVNMAHGSGVHVTILLSNLFILFVWDYYSIC
jgi:hypothetical protein